MDVTGIGRFLAASLPERLANVVSAWLCMTVMIPYDASGFFWRRDCLHGMMLPIA
jgi:hypothetical protein